MPPRTPLYIVPPTVMSLVDVPTLLRHRSHGLVVYLVILIIGPMYSVRYVDASRIFRLDRSVFCKIIVV